MAGVLSLALILSGCITHQNQQPAPVEPAQPQPPVTVPQQPETPPALPPVPQVPKIQTINWDASVKPLVAQMLQASGVTPGGVLMIAGVRNSTNGSIQSAKATAALVNALSGQSQFQLVTPQQLTSARQTLGLSAEDSLSTRSKAVGLARYLNAQYVLYTNASGDVKSPALQMQLMLVQTGEIVWSGNGVAQN